MLSETTEHAPCKLGGRGAKAELVMLATPLDGRTSAVLAEVNGEGEVELRQPASSSAAQRALIVDFPLSGETGGR